MEINAAFRIQKIEILNSTLITPTDGRKIELFNFELNLQTFVNRPDKLFIVFAEVKVKEGSGMMVGQFAAGFHYLIENLDEVLKDSDDVPKDIFLTFVGISASTLRGLMFGAFKGTFLHEAILPAVDLNQIQPMLLPPTN